jgi:HSP20 family protein
MTDVKEAPKPKTEAPRVKVQPSDIQPKPPIPAEANPMAFMRRFAEEIDRVFEDFGLRLPSFFGRGRELLRREVGLIPAEWSPRIDIQEQDGKMTVRADLPGLSKDDVQVEVVSGLLTLKGERRQQKQEQRGVYSYSECSYGSFYRAIPLPEGVDPSRAVAEFHNGVLEVTLPVPTRAETRPKVVEVVEKK